MKIFSKIDIQQNHLENSFKHIFFFFLPLQPTPRVSDTIAWSGTENVHFFKTIFYWSIVALQCCVNFYCSVHFSSIAQSCLTLCNSIDCSMPGFPVHHQLLEPTQTHIYDVIQPSHPLLSPSPPGFNLSQHQDLFQWVSSSHQVAKVFL